MKKFIDALTYIVLLIMSFFVRFFSRGLQVSLGKFTGRLFMLLFPSRVDIAKDNLMHAFPENSDDWIKIVTRESFENLGITLVEILAMKYLSAGEINKIAKFNNVELFRKLHNKNKGVILLSAHFGNWEIGALAGSMQLGVKYLIIVEHQANDFVNKEINKIRTRFGNRVISRYKAAREIVKTLQRGEVLALIADQSASERNDVYVDFFGRPAATFDSPAALALKFDVPIIFCLGIRQSDNSYIVDIKEIKHDDLTNDKEGILELTRRHTKYLEDMIRKYPGHWSWMHRRWKHTPPPGMYDA